MTVHELSGVTAISAGYNYGLALLAGGTVRAWGENRYGELGNNSETSSAVPVGVSGLGNVTAISAGEYHNLALLEDHKVAAWGSNEFGQLGDGTTEGPEKCSGYACSKIPIEVGGLTEVSAVSAGISHSLALLKDGKVMAWGENRFGELGNGTTENSDVPVEVPGLSGVIAISAGGDFSLALLENGTVMAWGDNETGEVGDGNATGPEKCSGVPCSTVPVEVKGLSKITAISAGFSDSLALRENGTVTAWGWNEYGQLGDGSANGPEKCGTEACSRVPVAVSLLVRNVAGVSAGAYASLAYGPPGPIVDSVSPDTGLPSGGTPVTITGLNFIGVTAVDFGGTAGTIMEETPTTIVVKSPAGSGSVHITVTTSSGTIATSEEDSASRFRYVTTAGPEYGRCLKVAEGSGKYSGGACEVEKAGGSYEWTPGVGKAHFTLAGGGATFETNTKVKLVCKASSGAGEYTSAKEVGNTTIKFTECEYEGAKCTSAGAATGEVVTSSLEGELGWKEILHSQVALALFPTGEVGPFAEFKCGSTAVVIVGSVLVPVTADAMSTTSVMEYVAVKGDQKPQKFEGGLEDVLEFPLAAKRSRSSA